VKVLFDHNVDRRFRRHLPGHDISTSRELRWETLENGALLASATAGGFEAVLTVDKKIRHQQNLRQLPLAVVVLDAPSNALPDLIPFAPFVQDLFKAPLRAALYWVAPDGTVTLITIP